MSADLLKYFLTDVYDYPIDLNYMKRFVDRNSGNLKLALVFEDPFLKASLTFRYLWKNVLGSWPPFQMTYEFLKHTYDLSLEGDIDLKKFHEYIIDKVAFLKFLGIDGDSLQKKKEALQMELRDVFNVKKHILEKFSYRFSIPELPTENSIFVLYQNIFKNSSAIQNIREIDHSLSKLFDKKMYGFPDIIKSFEDYYHHSKKMSDYYDLHRFNIFNHHVNTYNNICKLPQTIFEIIANTALKDSAFCRFLLGAHVVYWQSGDAIKGNKLFNLTKTLNEGQTKNVILFKSLDKQEPNIECIQFHMMTFTVAHESTLYYIPRIMNFFVLVSDEVYPTMKSICTREDGALYYNIYDSLKTDNMINEHNLMYYDKYITSDIYGSYKLKPKINNKNKLHVFVIPEETTENDIVCNSDFIQHQWNSHLSLKSPFTLYGSEQYHPKHNVLLYDQFILNYYMEHKTILQNVRTSKKSTNVKKKYALIVVDNRENIFTVIATFITLMNLNDEWNLHLVCNNNNKQYFSKHFGDLATYHTNFYLPSKSFDIEIYNNLLKSCEFWETFESYEKVLFVQDDGMIIRKGLETSTFMNYDYVGAPWEMKWAIDNPNKFIKEQVNSEMVGNGGVSLRCPKSMKSICEKYKAEIKHLHYDQMQQEPEDVFFSRCCVKEKKFMPKYEEAKQFSVEQVLEKNTFGFHKFWVYHPLPQVFDVFDSYLNKYKL